MVRILSAYDLQVEHRPGHLHRNADGLSRIPCSQCGLTDLKESEVGTVNTVTECSNEF